MSPSPCVERAESRAAPGRIIRHGFGTAVCAAGFVTITIGLARPAPDVVIINAQSPEQAISEIAQPVTAFKNGRRTVRLVSVSQH
jgi:hypothetical protein